MPAGGNDDTVVGDAYTSETAAAIPALVAGRYQIIRWLGGGGMGRVYEVLDTELGEKVALKKLRGNLDEEALERFRREVRLTRRIQHPNVARMFDIGEIDGERFLTMELVVGEPLTGALGTPMPWSRLQPLAVQICAGLAAAHDKGVVHRDLKPDNVLVETTTGRVVLTDFGIARSTDEANVTQTGMIIGTPRYMSPEQLAGTAIDARADLFSLGVMLFELASGARPWPGDNAIAIAVAQATQPRQPLIGLGLPAAFVTCLDNLLAIDRDQRPSSAAAIGNVIAAISATAPAASVELIPAPPHAMATVSDPESAIAVLPFATSTGDEYISEGMREDLIDMLSRTPTLRVRPAGAIDTRAVDPREIGTQLGVDHVIVGSVRRFVSGSPGPSLRVAARLINVADGFQVWAHRIDCSDAEVLAVGDQLGQAIATALSTRAGKAHSMPTDPRVVELFLRARDELRRFWGEHALTATELLEEAAQLAPNSAPIAGLLACAATLAWAKLNQPELLAKARRHIERGIALDHAEAYLAASQLHWNLGDLDQAARDTRYALDRAPMSAPVHEAVGRMLMEIESLESGHRHLETSIALDPSRRQQVRIDLARTEALMGNYAAADRLVEELVVDPDPSVRQFATLIGLRFALWRQDIGAALTMFDRVPRITSGHLLIDLVKAFHDTKRFDPAMWQRAIDEIAQPDRPRRLQVSILQRAVEVGVFVGEIDRATAALEIAADLGLADIVWLDKLPMLAIDTPSWRAVRDQVAATASRALAIFRPSGRSSQPTMLGVSGARRR